MHRTVMTSATSHVTKQISIPNKTNKNVSTSKSSSAIKTKSSTASVSKITKLVLKPRAISKNLLTTKMASKKYLTKPVSIKSRSTVISHEATFRVENHQTNGSKSPSNKRRNAENALIEHKSVPNKKMLIADNDIHRNSKDNTDEMQQPLDMVQSSNITFLNMTKTVENPILQEITSTVVNCTSEVSSIKIDCASKIKISPGKTNKLDENSQKCKLKSYDPIKARQFIRSQREKRKETEKERSNELTSKEEIKRRLSALQRNSLKIVGKNVQKARQSTSFHGKTKIMQTETKYTRKSIRG